MTKICSRCNKEKDINCFGKDKYNKDGYKYICKECEKEKRNKYKCVCETCGNIFKSSLKNSKYCCQKCKPQSQSKKINTKCDTCGKDIYIITYRLKRSKYHYCSKECADKGWSKFYSGKNSPQFSKIKTKCFTCGKDININTYRFDRSKYNYCSKECKNKGQGLLYRGENHSRYSKVAFKCEICGKETSTVLSQYNNAKHHYCSRECNYKGISKFYSGKNSPFYNYSISDEEREIGRFTEGYKEFIKKVYKRDNYTCQCCGDNKGGNLVAHHLNAYNSDKENRTNIDNGITLCEKCHKDFHKKYGYGNNTKQQFIEFMQGNTEVIH